LTDPVELVSVVNKDDDPSMSFWLKLLLLFDSVVGGGDIGAVVLDTDAYMLTRMSILLLLGIMAC
jgi:hypothetical protein